MSCLPWGGRWNAAILAASFQSRGRSSSWRRVMQRRITHIFTSISACAFSPASRTSTSRSSMLKSRRSSLRIRPFGCRRSFPTRSSVPIVLCSLTDFFPPALLNHRFWEIGVISSVGPTFIHTLWNMTVGWGIICWCFVSNEIVSPLCHFPSFLILFLIVHNWLKRQVSTGHIDRWFLVHSFVVSLLLPSETDIFTLFHIAKPRETLYGSYKGCLVIPMIFGITYKLP